MRHVYRVLFLLAVFGVSIWFFGSNMDEIVFETDTKTVEMKAATLPTMTIVTCGEEINLLHGYTSNLDTLLNREDVVPVGTDKTFFLRIAENESVVRKLKYEVADTTNGDVIDSGTVSAFDTEAEDKQVKLKLSADLKPDTEYAIKVTLITNQSKRIYYYFRIKLFSDAHLSEKLAFVMDFHTKAMSRDEAVAQEIIPYLEIDPAKDNTSFARVDIHSSYPTVKWGDLTPVVVTKIIPSVKEIYEDMATVVLDYIVEIPTNTATERYRVKEAFRVRYTKEVTYLLNYEREMESLFDVALASLSQSELKLGITADTDMELVTNSDNSIVSFVRNRTLYSYSLAQNQLVRVFSFETEEQDVRTLYDQHGISILKMDEVGDLNFLVYGYMNRGEYEGRVGVVLYHYYREEGRIEELLYIPVNSTYQILKEELGSFGYMNAYDVFYFMVYRNLYSFNLITKELTVIAENVAEDALAFSMQDQYVAYQEAGENDRIQVLYLETGERSALYPREGEYIRLMGEIDENLICGYGLFTDRILQKDGSIFEPLYRLEICDGALSVLKEYQKEGYYVTKTQTDGNVISLTRVQKDGDGFYEEAPAEYILNQDASGKEKIALSKRVTDLMRTEYYISFPSAYVMEEIPKVSATENTVLTQDTTVRIQEMESGREEYYTYYFGKIYGIYENAGEAVALADALIGTVLNEEGKVVWERGVKTASAAISGVSALYVTEERNSIQAAVGMLLAQKSVQVEISKEEASQDLTEVLGQYVKARAISLSGASLDEVLYFIYRGQPVLAMKDAKEAVVLTGYTSGSVTYIDPVRKREVTMELDKAAQLFEEAGNIYISFIP